ncbi:MAG: hypothetical protein AAGA43_15520 [Bacteroidota bacterium]
MVEVNMRQVQVTVLGIFVLIFALIIWLTSSGYYKKKEYLDFKKMEFKATLASKIDKHPTRGNEIYLNNGPYLIVYRKLFDKLRVGDSIIKKANSDSIYFHTTNGIIIDDYNAFKRKKYLESLK